MKLSGITMKMTKWLAAGLPAMIMLFALSACSSNSGQSMTSVNGEGKPKETQSAPEPVTVKIGLAANGYYNDREFEQYVVQPVKAKYPYITIEKKVGPVGGAGLEETVASGDVPDIFIASSLLLDSFIRTKLLTNMEPLIKQENLDLGRFKPFALQYTKNGGGENYLTAIPYNHNYSVTAYNKDIFDKFAVPYPKDGMTWEETTELAKKLTRSEGGVQYRGLEADTMIRPASVLRLQKIDPATNKAVVNTDGWKRVFEMLRAIYQIPGNGEIATGQNAFTQFMKDQRLAMLTTLNVLTPLEDVDDSLHWDLVQYPQFKEAPNTGINFGAHVALITSSSKVKEAAMRVISVIVSDEVQLDAARNGRISVLNNPQMQAEFGNNLPFLKGKNVQSIFKAVPAEPTPSTEFDSLANPILNTKLKQIVDGKDMNTALREAVEEINQKIEDAK